jgi:hypothetical protein
VNAWHEYCQSGKRPDDIPRNPYEQYKDNGWVTWGDWLGSGNIGNSVRQFRTFRRARDFVRGLGLRSQAEWWAFCKSDRRPSDIPTNPWETYVDKGWVDLGDWLGSGTVATRLRQYRPFQQARTFVRDLGLRSQLEWKICFKGGKLPRDFPAKPDQVYQNQGWSGWGDWLGTDRVANQRRAFLPYVEAMRFAQALGLKSETEWREYCASGRRPANIPSAPWQQYRNAGWVNWGHWLGTGNVANYNKKYRAFSKARAFARSLGLKTGEEWLSYAKSGTKPDDIPTAVWNVYKDDGWNGWPDWLGADRKRRVKPPK